MHTAGLLIFLAAMATKCGTSLLGIRTGRLGASMVMDTCVGAIRRPSVAQTAGSETRAEQGAEIRRPAVVQTAGSETRAEQGAEIRRPAVVQTAGSETRAEQGAEIRRPAVVQTAGSETRAEQGRRFEGA